MTHSHSPAIEYVVSFPDLAGHRIHVEMTIAHPDPQGQVLFLPAWIPGSYLIRDFSRQIETIQATSNDRPVDIQKRGDHEWVCAPCAGPLQLKYVIYAWDLSVRTARVDENYAFLNGTSVFLGVRGQEDVPQVVCFEAPQTHPEWRVYTSLPCAQEHPQAAQRHQFGAYTAPDYDALLDHPVLLGQPLVTEFEVYGARHELVFTQPVPDIDLERIRRDVEKICATQIELFEPDTREVPFLDSADRYTFITMVTENSYGGLEHRSSTALMIPRHHLPTRAQADAPVTKEYQSFLGLVSHEYFHTWNVKRIKPAAFSPYQLLVPNHTHLLWVFEGFTSYYDDLLVWRAGAVTRRAYLDRLEQIMAHVYRGSGRFKQSIAHSSYDAWTRFYKQDENSPNAIVSYYTKGALAALGLDLLIQQRTDGQHSLDDVMRYMWQHYGKHYYRGQPKGIGEDDMPAIIEAAVGVDCSDYIEHYVYGCADLPLPELLKQQGIEMRWQAQNTAPSLNVLLDDGPAGLTIRTVYEQGAAHRAGLSAGDTLIAINQLRVPDQSTLKQLLSRCQADQEVLVHFFRDGVLQERRVRLFPAPQDKCVLIDKSESTHE